MLMSKGLEIRTTTINDIFVVLFLFMYISYPVEVTMT